MRPAYPAAGDRQRPDQDPPARTKQGPAITPAGPGPPGDLGLDDRPLRDRRPDQSSRRSSRHRPRQDLVHQDPAPRPPYRYRYGGLSPLRTGTRPSPTSWLRSAAEPSPNAVTAPAHGHSNASATTATASRNAARPAAPATPVQPPSESTPSNPEQPDRNYATWHCVLAGVLGDIEANCGRSFSGQQLGRVRPRSQPTRPRLAAVATSSISGGCTSASLASRLVLSLLLQGKGKPTGSNDPPT